MFIACGVCVGAYLIFPHDTVARQAGPAAIAILILMFGFSALLRRIDAD